LHPAADEEAASAAAAAAKKFNMQSRSRTNYRT